MKKLLFGFFILTFAISCKKDTSKNDSSNSLQSSVIGNSVKIGNLEIAQNDFPYKLDWATATKSCTDLGLGWRLPSSGEFNIISDNLSKVPGIKLNQGGYWLSQERKAYEPSNKYEGGENKSSPLYVRAVRSF